MRGRRRFRRSFRRGRIRRSRFRRARRSGGRRLRIGYRM